MNPYASQDAALQRALLRPYAPVTAAIAGVMVLTWLAELRWPELAAAAATSSTALTAEPWRLVAALFVHLNVFHLVANVWSLWLLGGFLERLVGPGELLLVFLVAGVNASLSSAAFHHSTVGASGAVLGLLGCVTALGAFPGVVSPPMASKLLRFSAWPIAINLLLAVVVPGLDLAAHGVGLLSGAVSGLVMSWSRRRVGVLR